MKNNILIRKATLADVEYIVQFNVDMAYETENIILNIEVLRKGVQAVLKDKSKGYYIIAEVDSKIVAQLMITYEWSDWRNSQFWWIQSVFVLPSYRRKGVFKKLYEYIYKLAQEENNVRGLRLYVDENNKSAKCAYESLGMSKSHYHMYEVIIQNNS